MSVIKQDDVIQSVADALQFEGGAGMSAQIEVLGDLAVLQPVAGVVGRHIDMKRTGGAGAIERGSVGDELAGDRIPGGGGVVNARARPHHHARALTIDLERRHMRGQPDRPDEVR